MKPTVQARIVLIVLALAFGLMIVYGQGVTQLPDRKIYRELAYEFSVQLTRSDSALTTTAVLKNTLIKTQLLRSDLQPTVTRTGRIATISWSKTQTAQLPEKAFLEISAGGDIRLNADVYTNKDPTNTTPPGMLTVVSPVAEGPQPISTERTFQLTNAPPTGYPLNHNRGTPLVDVIFYREDTGQIDRLWTFKITGDNSVEVKGPPNETFTGKAVVRSTPILSN